MQTTETRLDIAQRLLDEYDGNDFGGSSSVEELAAAAYAVHVQREDDAWVLAAMDATAIAGIYLESLFADYSEWIADVFRMSDGERVAIDANVNVMVAIADEVGRASA